MKISPRVIIALKPFSNICNKLEIWKYCLNWVGTNHNGLYSEALPKRGTFFRLLVYDTREVISLVEVDERVGKSVIVVCKKAQKGLRMQFMVYRYVKGVPFVKESYKKKGLLFW